MRTDDPSSTCRRTAGVIAIALAFLTIHCAGRALALAYVESSQGLIPPTMDGGRTEIEFSDVNADGRVDILSIGDHGSPYVNTDEHGIMVWFGDGFGAWSVYQNGNFGYGGIGLGDVNGDGLIDAAYGMHHNYGSGDFGNQVLEVALGDGTGRNWIPWDDGLASEGESWGMFGTDLADIDNDGDLDVGSVSFGCCDGLHVDRNNGNGTWTHTWGQLGGNSGMIFLFGDVNADGLMDLVVSHDAGTVFLGDGRGGFVNADGNLPPGGPAYRSGPSLGDIDNDGDLDIAYRASDASLQVWLWNGLGSWINASAGLPTSGIAATQLCDMNGDGWLDVIGLGNGILRVWLGNGGTGWTLAATINLPSPGTFEALRVGGDVDHNGRPDIAVVDDEGSYPSDHNRFHVFRESSIAESLAVRFASPRGGERFAGGSTRFVDWITAVPGSLGGIVSIDLSTTGPNGPWVPIATGLADGGRFQWRIPVVPATDSARLRIRVSAGGHAAEAITPRSFSILPPTGAGVDEGHDRSGAWAGLTIPNPSSDAVRIVWAGDAGSEPIRIIDAGGRVLRILPSGASSWDGRDGSGATLATGVYYLKRGPFAIPLIRIR